MKYSAGTIFLFCLLIHARLQAEDGYRLWLRYDRIADTRVLSSYQKSISGWMIEGQSQVLSAAGKELGMGLNGLLASEIQQVKSVGRNGIIIAGTPEGSAIIGSLKLDQKLKKLNGEGYIILSTTYKNYKVTVIAANSDIGVLYGAFHFLRLLQTSQKIDNLDVESEPKTRVRILDHWDNINRSVERGYAGLSIWDWKSLPDSVSPRYLDYARANASIGINGSVLTNVNSNALFLTHEYLVKFAVVANILRPYGIRVYLTAKWSAPIEIGKLATADPLDPVVIEWWQKKVNEIYALIPDFGGFLVKANSEGQPGPQNYKRTHADGANMLADALSPHNGIVMWRAFVYDNNVPDDRAKQAYNEFVPLDGKFRDNVLIQVKNGPIDFQPREPFHPLFGAMPKTAIMPEFQITQEYLGASVHLVFLAPLFEECLNSDTWAKGKGSLVASVVDGTLEGHKLTGMAGVANIGSDRNWTGHPFAQANWYAFGRLSWDPYMKSSDIAEEWIRMTFSNDPGFTGPVRELMLASREITVNYMTPLGLHHIMYTGHHYGPSPWANRGRQDWTPVYYHKADSAGIGFERSSKGSNAVAQYYPEVRNTFDKVETTPENLLLWFHHVPWDYKMKSGKTLWDEMCFKYNEGVNSVIKMENEWQKLGSFIDMERFEKVKSLLTLQEEHAKIWRDACILYFQTYSKRQIPASLARPEHDLKYYMDYRYTNVPGIR
jgi:alpha-glucuronidase